ncbi:MAG: adenosylcobinamide-GDP ribazoletransferase [Rhodobacterales bacterium 32-67-9]|nr:MAG: adenosylcobinamide-GDP ribazoletransferase [Rhodobacterales bacterium 32-67-9]
MSAGRVEELRLAFLLLTRLPVGAIRGAAPDMASSSWAWPVVGVAVGVIAALGAGIGHWLGLPPAMAAILALTASVLATGGMHEDGLADVADGFGGGHDRARKLEIMRDSRIGSYGVLALVLVTGFRGLGIAEPVAGGTATAALIGIAAASRAVLPAALLIVPPARADGLGRSAAGSDPRPALIAAAIGALCLLPLGFGTALAIAFAVALAATAIAALAMRQIGGQTGDVMGAIQQLAECAGWAVLVVAL